MVGCVAGTVVDWGIAGSWGTVGTGVRLSWRLGGLSELGKKVVLKIMKQRWITFYFITAPIC